MDAHLGAWKVLPPYGHQLDGLKPMPSQLLNLPIDTSVMRLSTHHISPNMLTHGWHHDVQHSIAMPDIHAGYGFCIGNVAAFDMDDPSAVVSPGGVGFDINCGVRLIRTNLTGRSYGLQTMHIAQASFDCQGQCPP